MATFNVKPATNSAGTQEEGFARYFLHSILLMSLHHQNTLGIEALLQKIDLLLDKLHQQ